MDENKRGTNGLKFRKKSKNAQKNVQEPFRI
jgi:hypothetical protein